MEREVLSQALRFTRGDKAKAARLLQMVDIFEEKDYLVVAEIPGVSADEVQLTVKDELLTIYAEKPIRNIARRFSCPVATPGRR